MEFKFVVEFAVKGREQSTEQQMEQDSKNLKSRSKNLQSMEGSMQSMEGSMQSIKQGSDKSREEKFAVNGREKLTGSMEQGSKKLQGAVNRAVDGAREHEFAVKEAKFFCS